MKCLEVLHNAGVVHGDVTPKNICLGVGNNIDEVRLIDLGMSKTYLDPVNGNHIAQATSLSFTGTVRFASLNTHKMGTLNRTDDLESLCYTMMGLYKGSLPWVTEAKNGFARPYLVAKKWKSKPVAELCAGYPKFFADFLGHLRNTPFGHHPGYSSLQVLLDETAKNCQDW